MSRRPQKTAEEARDSLVGRLRQAGWPLPMAAAHVGDMLTRELPPVREYDDEDDASDGLDMLSGDKRQCSSALCPR